MKHFHHAADFELSADSPHEVIRPMPAEHPISGNQEIPNQIRYEEHKVIPIEQLIALYADVGWIDYSCKPEKIKKAFQNSLHVISAWD